MEEVKTFRLSFPSLLEGRAKVVPFPTGMGKSVALFFHFLPKEYLQALEKAYLEAGVKNRSQRRELISIICSDRQRQDLFSICFVLGSSALKYLLKQRNACTEVYILSLLAVSLLIKTKTEIPIISSSGKKEIQIPLQKT